MKRKGSSGGRAPTLKAGRAGSIPAPSANRAVERRTYRDGTLITCPRKMRDLLSHVGHDISCVYYGPDKRQAVNVALECETCGAVLLDIDRSEE